VGNMEALMYGINPSAPWCATLQWSLKRSWARRPCYALSKLQEKAQLEESI